MTKKPNYLIVADESADSVEKAVSQLRNEGWQLHGPIDVVVLDNRVRGYHQVMITAPNDSGSEIPYSDSDLVSRALQRAKPDFFERDTPRGELAKRVFGVDQAIAVAICSRFGLDPDEEVASPYEHANPQPDA